MISSRKTTISGAQMLRLDEGDQRLRQLRHADEEREGDGAEEQHVDQRRVARDIAHHAPERIAVETAARQSEEERKAAADRAGLGRGEDAGIDAADHRTEQRDHAPTIEDGGDDFAQRDALDRSRRARLDAHIDRDRQDIEHRREQRREDGGDENLVDRGLGQHGIEHHDARRRDQRAERAAGGDAAGRELRRVTAVAHLRHGDGADGRRGRQRRAGDGAESSAASDRRDGETAAAPREKRMRQTIGIGREPGRRGKAALHQEERQHDEVEAREIAGGLQHDRVHRRIEADEHAAAGEPGASHRDADRDHDRDRHPHRTESEHRQGDRRRRRCPIAGSRHRAARSPAKLGSTIAAPRSHEPAPLSLSSAFAS